MFCYEGKFSDSNHETDPASKQLCNAFDLCRIHLFGVQDEGTKITDNTRLPSYLKMQDFVAKDKKVRILLTKERQGQSDYDFADIEADEAGDSAVSETACKWIAGLDLSLSPL